MAAHPTDPLRPFKGGFFTFVGLVILTFVFLDVQSTRELIRTGQRVQGLVTELAAGTSHPMVAFEAAGERIEFPGNGFVSHRKGERVAVLFDASSPHTSAILDEPGALWFTAVGNGLLGGGMLIAGLSLLLRRRGAAKQNAPPCVG